jgi:predicted dehydrogenase
MKKIAIFFVLIGMVIGIYLISTQSEQKGGVAQEHTIELKPKLTKPECNIVQDPECLDQMMDYADEVLAQGYNFRDITYSETPLSLAKFGQKGVLILGTNDDYCATLTWRVNQEEHLLYSATMVAFDEAIEDSMRVCEVEGEAGISLRRVGEKLMVLLRSTQSDPYGGTGTSELGTVCEIDFGAKAVINCQSDSIGIH